MAISRGRRRWEIAILRAGGVLNMAKAEGQASQRRR
jgi:hypothetical protein